MPACSARRSSGRWPRSSPSTPTTRRSRAANDTEFGLVAYVYTTDLNRALRMSEGLETGMVGLNQGMVSNPAAPFGGIKESGYGREGGTGGHRGVPRGQVHLHQAGRLAGSFSVAGEQAQRHARARSASSGRWVGSAIATMRSARSAGRHAPQIGDAVLGDDHVDVEAGGGDDLGRVHDGGAAGSKADPRATIERPPGDRLAPVQKSGWPPGPEIGRARPALHVGGPVQGDLQRRVDGDQPVEGGEGAEVVGEAHRDHPQTPFGDEPAQRRLPHR